MLWSIRRKGLSWLILCASAKGIIIFCSLAYVSGRSKKNKTIPVPSSQFSPPQPLWCDFLKPSKILQRAAVSLRRKDFFSCSYLPCTAVGQDWTILKCILQNHTPLLNIIKERILWAHSDNMYDMSALWGGRKVDYW
jgi:hypothetical protein